MGRKGISKRKPSQNKSKSNSDGGAGNSVSSVVHASEGKSGNTFDTGKSERAGKGTAKSGSDRKKNHK